MKKLLKKIHEIHYKILEFYFEISKKELEIIEEEKIEDPETIIMFIFMKNKLLITIIIFALIICEIIKKN